MKRTGMAKRLCLVVLTLAIWAAALPAAASDYLVTSDGDNLSDAVVVADYSSDTLRYTIRQYSWNGVICYATSLWLAVPGQQIHKATADWEKNLQYPLDIAGHATAEPAVIVNGSGFISRVFPQIPKDYPGESADYYNTPWGTLTVTDYTVYRKLNGLLFTGLTLEGDGLRLHQLEDIPSVLAGTPSDTWSFYDYAVVIKDGEIQIDPTIPFNTAVHTRNIVAKLDENNYMLITVTGKSGSGMTMVDAAQMVQTLFKPQWAFNLDGNGSYALIARPAAGSDLEVLVGNKTQVADIMYFSE